MAIIERIFIHNQIDLIIMVKFYFRLEPDVNNRTNRRY
jgi:hypothetical protein